jgi:multidrug efflux pump
VVDKEVLEINKTLPPGTKMIKAVDNSIFTAEAIHEVWVTMGISIGLVALVNLVFLGSWRSALIPSIIAPICILSTFIILAPLGFSLNLLTLLALVLAVGLVVDDAIVVVENIQRRVDEGEPANVAALRGTRQVFFAVVATTIVLISVFAPLMFLPGYIGRLFVELAVAIAAAVGFSALLALSLSPMLASKLLKPASGGSWFNRKVDHAMDALEGQLSPFAGAPAGQGARPPLAAGLSVLVLAVVAGRAVRRAAAGTGAGRGSRSRRHLDQRPRGRGFRLRPPRPPTRSRRSWRSIAPTASPRGPSSPCRALARSQFNTGNGVLVAQGLGRTRQDRRRGGGRTQQEPQQDHRRAGRGQRARRLPARRRRGRRCTNVDLIATGNDYVELANWLKPILERVLRTIRACRDRASTTSRPRRACRCRSTGTRPPAWAFPPSRSAGRWKPCSDRAG